jgi:hypothetical protein
MSGWDRTTPPTAPREPNRSTPRPYTFGVIGDRGLLGGECGTAELSEAEAYSAFAQRNSGQIVHANNSLETDHGRLKARLRPMRGLKRDHTARVIVAGHAFVQNLRGAYDLGTDAPAGSRLADAFAELALAICTTGRPESTARRLRSTQQRQRPSSTDDPTEQETTQSSRQ